ncbi:MAG TPA: hypothetical protein VIF62_08105, partial [Labilithrix sp.]
VAVAYITGEDGSKGFYQFVDTVHENEPCVFARASDGMTRCLPQGGDWGTVWDDLFVEGTCSTPWAQLLYYTKCPTKFGWQDTDRASCNPGFHVYPIGASVTGSHVWISMGAESCTDDGASQNQGFTTGPEIPAATFSTVTAGPNYGTTRLVRTTQVTSGGIVMAGGWFDTKRSQACSAFADATGTLRCMPNGNSATTYYSDATCTQPLYQDYAAACGVPPPAQVELMVVDHTTCPAHYRVYEKGASYTGTVYEKYGIGACTTTTTLPPSPLYSLGAEIAPTDLADFTEVVVP